MRRAMNLYTSLIEPGRRGRWLVVLMLAIVVSGFEALGAILIFLLIALAADPQADLNVPIFGDLRRILPDLRPDHLVILVAAGVAGFFLVRAAATLGQHYYQARVSNSAAADLSARLLDRYLHTTYAFHLRRNSATLIRNIQHSVYEILMSVFTPAVTLVSDGILVMAIVLVMLLAAPGPTGMVVIILAPLVFIVFRSIQPRIGRLGVISQEMSGQSLQALQQSLLGFRDITVLGRHAYFLATFNRAQRIIAKTRSRRAVLNEFPRVAIETIVVSIIALFLIISTTVDGTSGSLQVLGLFAYAALRIMPALTRVVRSLNAIRFGRAAVNAVLQDLDLAVAPERRTSERLDLSEALEVEGVEFMYEGTETPALRDINLTILPGMSVGIVGATGSGKSTLVDIIVGLSEPTAGRVLIDRQDLRDVVQAWHGSIGLVSQQVFLMDDTLRRNIALGVSDEEIDEGQVREALRLAQLREFVESLPAGLNTIVGERGVRMSGGQRQRVAIARALYPRPSTLVFDEGTSALDNMTEALLIDALDRLRANHTIVTVAHRLSTVHGYDCIVFMRDGQIDDIGTFTELLDRNDEFRRLARWTEAAH